MPKDKFKINVKDRIVDNVLDLSLSEIEHIPVSDIALLRRMTVLDLSSNNIKFIPKNFGASLARLTRLDLSKNHLKFLNDDFCNLVNLKHLDLYNNQLENLPVTFGRLSKLRYLDLKGNPLQPTLLKIVGPCYTTKDCLDAAKQIVPFMGDLEVKFMAEQKKREDDDRRRKEEEAQEARELVRVAKKAARKERVMRERQEKAEAEKLFVDDDQAHDEPTIYPTRISNRKAAHKSESNFLPFLKTFISVLFLLLLIFFVFFKFFANQSDKFVSILPKQQQKVLRYIFETIDGSISSVFQRVLNLYKM